jgi:S1-C subfamily serine protease
MRSVRRPGMCARAFAALVALACLVANAAAATDARETIRHVKASVVAVGTFERTRSPEFEFRGTGFVAGTGNTIVTNAHVLPESVDPVRGEAVAVLVSGGAADLPKVRSASLIAIDTNVDLALLHVDGDPLPVLPLMDSDAVQEGQEVLITGYPLGPVLGAFATTHRGMISAIAPIAIPQPRAQALDAAVANRLKRGVFPVFQLDATAYPGNSGSPVYDPATGSVLGIVNMVFVKGTKEAALTNPSGITYAMPARHLQALLERNRIGTAASK